MQDEVKEERLARLQELQKVHPLKLNRAQIGSVWAVMLDGRSRSGGGQLKPGHPK